MQNTHLAPTSAIIGRHFPQLTSTQLALFHNLQGLYFDWNAKVNLISRKDILHLYLHHVLHALAIAKVMHFAPPMRILDFGTGGGFPGLPLAIFFPTVHFHLVDSITKKMKALEAIVASLGLQNVSLSCRRGELLEERYDFVVGRAVTGVAQFYHWTKDKVVQKNGLTHGILYLSGPIAAPWPSMRCYALRDFFQESFFQEKYLLHIVP